MTAATDLPARLAALRARVEAMTPGPWRVGTGIGDPFYASPHDIVSRHVPGDDESTDDEWILAQMNGNFPERGPADARGIVALRNEAIPLLDALLAEVQRLADENAGYRKQFAEANENAPRALVDALDSLTRAVVRAETAENERDALLAEVQAARAEAVALREAARSVVSRIEGVIAEADVRQRGGLFYGLAFGCADKLRTALATTPDPAAAQAALDEYTEAVMEACGVIDAERTPRTISARATVARLLGLPEVAR